MTNKERLKEDEYRCERKFFVDCLSAKDVLSHIRLHPAHFTEVYHQRYINNIYFDSLDMTSYMDNVDGCSRRAKARIRWYGDLLGKIEKPVLEIKIKEGLAGRKKSIPLKSFSLDKNFRFESIEDLFEGKPPSELDFLRHLRPTLLNRYSRRYYISACANYRITVDDELSYYKIYSFENTFLSSRIDEHGVVVELKYAVDLDTEADRISAEFPFRMTKNSKYVTGITNTLDV